MAARTISRNARSALLWGLTVAMASEFALSYSVEYHLPWLRDELYGAKLAQLRARLATSTADTRNLIMLGSSKTLTGLRADLLQSAGGQQEQRDLVVYNFGMPGAGPLTELLMLERLLREGIRPDDLWVEFVPIYLLGNEAIVGCHDRFYSRELGEAAPFLDDARAVGVARWSQAVAPCFAHRLAILRRIAPHWAPPTPWEGFCGSFDEHGWHRVNPLSDELDDKIREQSTTGTHEAHRKALRVAHLSDPARQAMRRLLALCQAEKIRTVLIWLPEGDGFRQLYSPEALEEVERFLSDLARDYPIHVVDARDWADDQEFVDDIHLASPGASDLTARLGNLLPVDAQTATSPSRSAARGTLRR